MKVILLQDVSNLGSAGEVKEVRNGFARNYLLPHGLATVASPAALKQVEEQRRIEEHREKKVGKDLGSLAEKLQGKVITLQAKAGSEGRLYGSVTNADIAEALSQEVGQEVDKHKVELEEPLKQLGRHEVTIRFTKNLLPKVTVIIEEEKKAEEEKKEEG